MRVHCWLVGVVGGVGFWEVAGGGENSELGVEVGFDEMEVMEVGEWGESVVGELG